jgi:hypothetical protein
MEKAGTQKEIYSAHDEMPVGGGSGNEMARFKTANEKDGNVFQGYANEDRPLGGSGKYNFEQEIDEYDEYQQLEYAE